MTPPQNRTSSRSRSAHKVTIRDVASAAGVSTATVSYVLNDTPGQVIMKQTQDRVRAAASELGYVPNSAAKAFREGMSRIVLLKVGSMLGGRSLDRFIIGMSDELGLLDHSLLVAAGPAAISGGAPAKAIDALMPRAVIDLVELLNGAHDDHPLFGIANGYRTGITFHTLTQLRYLFEQGHREIVFAFPADQARSPVAGTFEGATRIAAELGFTRVHPLVLNMDEGNHGRADSVRAIIEESLVTAVAASSDDVAFGVLSAMTELGLSAPKDLAVIGFDDGAHSQLWRPALTTVSIDAESFGRRAARIAIGLDPGEWIQPPSEVIVRETT